MAKRAVRQTAGIIMLAWSPAVFFLVVGLAESLRSPWQYVVATFGLFVWLGVGTYLAESIKRPPAR
ncbi:MAG: hypothetical protein IT406_00785 [Candidatus Yanofskybacteria bacterium]|nr:hypothetical protein [Candidatus Yanofskybacteria bacterium]